MHSVFVFGTLKEGFANYHVNLGVRVGGEYVTSSKFPLYLIGDRHSPWMINMEGRGKKVRGQVFKVDKIALEAMDRLERIHEPDGYQRISIQVASEQDILIAFAYVKPASALEEADIKAGPLECYEHQHDQLYRPREGL